MLLPYVHMENSINSNAWFCIPCLWKAISAVVHQAPAIHIKSYNNGFLFVQKPISAAHRFPHLMESNLPWLTCWNPNYIGEQVEKWWFQSEILRAECNLLCMEHKEARWGVKDVFLLWFGHVVGTAHRMVVESTNGRRCLVVAQVRIQSFDVFFALLVRCVC
jgi:hypothetical protein